VQPAGESITYDRKKESGRDCKKRGGGIELREGTWMAMKLTTSKNDRESPTDPVDKKRELERTTSWIQNNRTQNTRGRKSEPLGGFGKKKNNRGEKISSVDWGQGVGSV